MNGHPQDAKKVSITAKVFINRASTVCIFFKIMLNA